MMRPMIHEKHLRTVLALALSAALAGCANMPGAGLSFKTGELPPAPTDRKWPDADRDALVETVSGSLLAGVREPVLSRAFEYWKNIDPTVGQRIQDKVTQAAKAKK